MIIGCALLAFWSLSNQPLDSAEPAMQPPSASRFSQMSDTEEEPELHAEPDAAPYPGVLALEGKYQKLAQAVKAKDWARVTSEFRVLSETDADQFLTIALQDPRYAFDEPPLSSFPRTRSFQNALLDGGGEPPPDTEIQGLNSAEAEAAEARAEIQFASGMADHLQRFVRDTLREAKIEDYLELLHAYPFPPSWETIGLAGARLVPRDTVERLENKELLNNFLTRSTEYFGTDGNSLPRKLRTSHLWCSADYDSQPMNCCQSCPCFSETKKIYGPKESHVKTSISFACGDYGTTQPCFRSP